MKHLEYCLHCKGCVGIGNALMSLELGVVLAALTGRRLLLMGNGPLDAHLQRGPIPPVRITDLFDLPVPWDTAETFDDTGLTRRSAPQVPFFESVFAYPARQQHQHPEDFLQFARGREYVMTIGAKTEQHDIISFPGLTEVRNCEGEPLHPGNLSYYSSFFYLGSAEKLVMESTLRGLVPKAPYRELARTIAASLGAYAAMHLRRGDRTARVYSPLDVLARLDYNYSRNSRLVILSDEAHAPFLAPTKEHFRDHVVIDDYIEQNFRRELAALPHRDPLVIALLSQLVAVEATGFIGTLTSTFTSLIQRWRGSAGKPERFQYLTGHLSLDDAAEPPLPLHATGEMVETGAGPYSWNRYSPELELSYMREWPEAFLTPQPAPLETTHA